MRDDRGQSRQGKDPAGGRVDDGIASDLSVEFRVRSEEQDDRDDCQWESAPPGHHGLVRTKAACCRYVPPGGPGDWYTSYASGLTRNRTAATHDRFFLVVSTTSVACTSIQEFAFATAFSQSAVSDTMAY
jgi:hypothetical protein